MTSSLPLLARAQHHFGRTALVVGESHYSYEELLAGSAQVTAYLLGGRDDLQEARIAFLMPPGLEYVTTLWGIWQAGGVAVPLCLQHPPAEWAYVLDDTGAAVVIAHGDFVDKVRPLAEARSLRLLTSVSSKKESIDAGPVLTADRRALILYTSGTTSKPKGVVTTHGNIQAQIETLVDAWEWTAQDRILHVLPLHHVHGIINVLLCALWSGAICEFLPRFDALDVWQRMEHGDLTLFMAVPTIYAKLISAWEQVPPEQQRAWSEGASRLRLMVSGSAALPVATLDRWQQITGHVLLERYGMTEIGMALTNPLHGKRLPGHVGQPFPGVELRLVDESGVEVAPGTPGEIEIRGPSVFREYWNKPGATASALRDGWFRTGDVAVWENDSYRILGRQNIDIIKTGGYKVSALEIEGVLLTHPAIQECAVVGVPDAEWGERVSACVVLAEGVSLSLDDLRSWAKDYLAAYKIPRALCTVNGLPRNAMGKVQKPVVIALFQEEIDSV